MKATFTKSKSKTWAYIQKSVRVNGVPTSVNVKKLGTLDDIKRRYGCDDPEQWVRELAAKMTADEKAGKETVTLELCAGKEMDKGSCLLRHGGDILMYPVYKRLGIPEVCENILKGSKVRYNLDEILRTLVFSRVIEPASKIKSYEFANGLVLPPHFKESDMYRALTLLSGHIDEIQAAMYNNSKKFMARKERVLYFDCSNYYFEIEENDPDTVDTETGEFIVGLRKRGKSKENRTSPIVQMGLFMDGDGIPLAFNIFPGNESEQIWLQPLEKVIDKKFDLTEFVVSTDSGLASEENRRYNMAEGRDYICVQSLPSLKADDQDMAIDPRGWRIAYCDGRGALDNLPIEDAESGVYNLNSLIEYESKHQGVLKNITLYREILVEKSIKHDNPEWIKAEKENPGKEHLDDKNKRIPRSITLRRMERLIVTYSHDYAQYLRHKREERVRIATAIVYKKDDKGRHNRQSPRRYTQTVYKTDDGQVATSVEMSLDKDAIKQDAKFDGFYAYGTSLDDDAIDVLKARSLHHEIEHLFRSTKTLLDVRPVHLSRPDRIKSHFLICFIAMTILKIMQKQISEQHNCYNKENPLTIDSLLSTIRDFRFADQFGRGFTPMFERTDLSDYLQAYAGINLNTQIITPSKMRAAYKNVNKA